jgi:hypothetical protein
MISIMDNLLVNQAKEKSKYVCLCVYVVCACKKSSSREVLKAVIVEYYTQLESNTFEYLCERNVSFKNVN